MLLKGQLELIIGSYKELKLETSVFESFTLANYRLTHSAIQLSGYNCTSSLKMSEKFQYRTRRGIFVSDCGPCSFRIPHCRRLTRLANNYDKLYF